MIGKFFLWAAVLCILDTNLPAQNIVRLKGTKPPIICYAEDKPGIQSRIDAPDIFLKLKRAGARTKTATIDVDYINFPSQARTAFAFAVSIWESLISSPVTIHITAVWTNLPTGTLGAAGPSFWASNFQGVPKFNVYYPGPLAEKLAQAELNGANEPDIVAQFNSTTNWYFQPTGTLQPDQYDFITVVLHEIGHGLGFTSTFDVEGGIGRYGEFTDGIPFPFDLAIENLSAQNLFQNFNSPSSQLGSQLTNNSTFIKTPSNASRAQLYAPTVFNDGSSIAHLDAATYPQGTPNSLMRPFINSNEVNHDPGPITENIFKDLGWVTTYINHDHVTDQENVTQPIPITAIVRTDNTSGYSFNPNLVFLNYALDGSPSFTQLQMLPTGNPDEFLATIPAPGSSAIVEYNIQITDNLNRTLTNPGEFYDPDGMISQKGPVIAYYSFRVGPDTQAPVIEHTPKAFVSYLDNELVIDVSVKESNGLAAVQLEYIFNDGTTQTSDFGLLGSEPDFFEGTTTYFLRETIPFAPGLLNDGDEIKYRIIAKDNSANENTGQHPASDYFIVPVEGLAPSRTYYINDFNTTSDDFIGSDFSITQPTGFNDPAIHSPHPYAEAGAGNQLEFTYQLRIPIIISEHSPVMTFDEIVLVEPGEDGSTFGQTSFYDFVVTEGSKDGGQTWIPVEDGYDSRANGTWLVQYNSNGSGNPSMFRKRTLDLSTQFSPGDEVVFRFRLYSDPFGSGWGWAIDNLSIQTDDVGPIILHNHIDYITDETSLLLSANTEDDLLIEKFVLEYKLNNGTAQREEVAVNGRSIIADFNIDVSGLNVGDNVHYKFEALDSAGNKSSLPTLGYFAVPKIQFEEPVPQYANTFNSITSDFVGNFFEIAQPGGFVSGALHTPHPYLAGFGTDNKSEFRYTLKKKIIINESNPYIKFDEVCLVEDHENSAAFGTSAFKDYVIVEASNDNGVTWKHLVEGYDSKAEAVWLTAYNENVTGSSSLFKSRIINILDTEDLSPNDEIIVRFRLYSNPTIQGWGWAIDNLHIQDAVTSVEVNSVISKVLVYPNPVVDDNLLVDLQLRNSASALISVTNIQGMVIQQQDVALKTQEKTTIIIDTSSFPNGFYLLKVKANNDSLVKKFIITR